MFYGIKNHTRWRKMSIGILLAVVSAGCSPDIKTNVQAKPIMGPVVSDNATPYSICLDKLGEKPGLNRPTVAIGNITDKTGKRAYDLANDSAEVTQGVSEW